MDEIKILREANESLRKQRKQSLKGCKNLQLS